MIDKKYTMGAFANYVRNYDEKDPKIQLKIIHTYKVATLSEEIARSVEGVDAEVAWLVGMLHDIGRFEQLRRFDTFIDGDSVSHADLGCEILYQDGLCSKMYEDRSLDNLCERAIRVHSLYRIPEDFPEAYLPYAKILRDADKIDILRANLETPLTDIYNVSEEELYSAPVTKEVMENFKKKQATPRALKKAAVDHVVGHISLAFELEYDKSREIIKQQGNLDKLLRFPSKNPETIAQFRSLQAIMEEYLVEMTK